MQPLFLDIEADGLLHSVTRVHCISISDGQRTDLYGPRQLSAAIDRLNEHVAAGGLVVGHNIIRYDIPVLQLILKLKPVPTRQIRDTLIMSQVLWADMSVLDQKRTDRIPGKMIGRHSLEAWGHRLGDQKGEYKAWCAEQGITDPFGEYRPEMGEYCVQDTKLVVKLYDRCVAADLNPAVLCLEQQAARILLNQEILGVAFDSKAAVSLVANLREEHAALYDRLVESVGSVIVRNGGVFVPKSSLNDYTPGAPLSKVKMTAFNPSSREQIGRVLIHRYGWEPQEYTSGGQPVIDENTLKTCDAPIVPDLLRLLLLEKRIGQIADGSEAWLKAERSGHIHHYCNASGTVTGRAAHRGPNLGQVPRVSSFLGAECRALFGPGAGRWQVGADLAGIELRMLAHYMAQYDKGAYAKVVVEGRQEDGTDVHSVNCRALGFEPTKRYTIRGRMVTGRDIAKTFIYAFLYGAGVAKLGSIVGKGAQAGSKLRKLFLANLPALNKLINAVKAASRKGYLRTPMGRRVPVRSEHAALNTLLQAAAAEVSKLWMVLASDRAGVDVYQMLWIHDELQYSAKSEEVAKAMGETLVQAARRAGEELGLRLPIDADFKVGLNWKECH